MRINSEIFKYQGQPAMLQWKLTDLASVAGVKELLEAESGDTLISANYDWPCIFNELDFFLKLLLSLLCFLMYGV